MKGIFFAFFAAVAACVLADGERREVTAAEIEQAIAQFEAMRNGEYGQLADPSQAADLDEAIRDMKELLASIGPNGVYIIPSPQEMKEQMLKLKNSAEWNRLSPEEREAAEAALNEIDSLHEHEHHVHEIQPAPASPPPPRRKPDVAGRDVYEPTALRKPSANRVVRRRLISE